jgi:hypothetical protein
MEKDMTREDEIKKLKDLILDAELRILESNYELAKALGSLRYAKRQLPKFKEMTN